MHDEDDSLDERAASTLRAGADGPVLSDDANARLRARVLASVGAVGAVGALGAVGASSAAGSSGATATAAGSGGAVVSGASAVGGAAAASGATVAAGLALAVALGVTAIVVVATRNDAPILRPAPAVVAPAATTPTTSPPPPVEPAPVANDTARPVDEKENVPAVVVEDGAAVPPRDRPPAPPPSPTTIAGWEVVVLGEARAALKAGDGAAALTLLDSHEARAPDSALGEERLALRALVLQQLGRLEEARAAARSFLGRYPSSTLAPRMQLLVAP